MKLRMHVETPKGEAQGAEKKLKMFLLGMHKPIETGYNDDGFYWVVDCSYKSYVQLQKKAYMFSQLAGGLVQNKVFKGAAQKLGATKDQLQEVQTMLLDGTNITIIKTATAEEFDEYGRTWWETFTSKFKRVE